MKYLISGFTLVELLIVIAIVGSLAAVMIPFLLGVQRRGYDAGAHSCAKSIQTVQSMAQVDSKTYLALGAGNEQINKSTDGVDMSCKDSNMFFKDRSDPSQLVSNFVVDVWDKRGHTVITVTPSTVSADMAGATTFSSTGADGINLP